MASIAIPAEYFAKTAKREYSNWRFALIREFFQNGYDAGATKIKIELLAACDTIYMRVENNGEPMTEDVLVNKLLTMGGSNKDNANNVGGFGKAKELCYFSHDWYTISTGNYIVTGKGGEYNITTTDNYVNGVVNEINIAGDASLHELLIDAVRAMINYSQMNCEIELHHNFGSTIPVIETHKPQLHKGTPRREFAWGKIYSNKSYTNKVIVRVNGVCMFTTWTGYDGCIIIELTGKSTDLLTSNRDSLQEVYRREYESFIGEISVNSSVLRKPVKTYTRYAGNRQLVSPTQKQPEIPETLTAESLAAFLNADAEMLVDQNAAETVQTLLKPRLEATLANSNPSQLSMEFIVKNETDLTIPEYMMPHSSKFSKYARTLAKYWANVLVEVHKLLNVGGNFAVGFVVSEDCRAQYECHKDYGVIYYLNPLEVVKQKNSKSRSLKTRLKLTDKDDIIASAVHEVVHGMGYESHNESYATKLTDSFAVILKNRNQLMKCFR